MAQQTFDKMSSRDQQALRDYLQHLENAKAAFAEVGARARELQQMVGAFSKRLPDDPPPASDD